MTALNPKQIDDLKTRLKAVVGGTDKAGEFFRQFHYHLFSYISHKVMRWFVPHMMVTAAVSNVFLLDQPAYMLIFIMQVLFYSLAFYGYQKHKAGKLLSMPVSLVVFFVSMNYALAVGFKRYFSTNIQGNWQRTER